LLKTKPTQQTLTWLGAVKSPHKRVLKTLAALTLRLARAR
jgi:hypothetical protein